MMTDEREATMSTEERLENLERALIQQKRRYHRLLAGLLAVFMGAIVVVMADSPQPRCAAQALEARKDVPDVIRARSFAVVDKKGNARITMGMEEIGPGLGLRDEKGNLRIGLVVDKDSSGLFLFGEKGRHTVALAVDKDDVGLKLFDEKGNNRIGLGVFKDQPGLCLKDKKDNTRIGLGVTELGPTLDLWDENEKTIWSAP